MKNGDFIACPLCGKGHIEGEQRVILLKNQDSEVFKFNCSGCDFIYRYTKEPSQAVRYTMNCRSSNKAFLGNLSPKLMPGEIEFLVIENYPTPLDERDVRTMVQKLPNLKKLLCFCSISNDIKMEDFVAFRKLEHLFLSKTTIPKSEMNVYSNVIGVYVSAY